MHNATHARHVQLPRAAKLQQRGRQTEEQIASISHRSGNGVPLAHVCSLAVVAPCSPGCVCNVSILADLYARNPSLMRNGAHVRFNKVSSLGVRKHLFMPHQGIRYPYNRRRNGI
jgi:hypothetical protein